MLIKHSKIKSIHVSSTAAALKRYVEEHYSEHITNAQLANIAICSVPSLYRTFNKYFHLSPHNYINKVRLEKASVLLENSSDSIASISEKVGFDDPAYFSKLFSEHYHLSPKKYRDSLRTNNSDAQTI